MGICLLQHCVPVFCSLVRQIIIEVKLCPCGSLLLALIQSSLFCLIYFWLFLLILIRDLRLIYYYYYSSYNCNGFQKLSLALNIGIVSLFIDGSSAFRNFTLRRVKIDVLTMLNTGKYSKDKFHSIFCFRAVEYFFFHAFFPAGANCRL